MTEKRQTSQGYIIRILQHFATKLWNMTNFVMLFQAVMKFFVQTCLDQNFTQKGKGLLYTSVSKIVHYTVQTGVGVRDGGRGQLPPPPKDYKVEKSSKCST
jgi:hypothetical protein